MLVYRAEKENGFGPYGWDDNIPVGLMEMGMIHVKDKINHPGPVTDFDDNIPYSSEYFFGFDSKEKLLKWFKGYKTELQAAGVSIKVYNCPKKYVNLSKSGKQLMFNRRHAKLKQTLSLMK